MDYLFVFHTLYMWDVDVCNWQSLLAIPSNRFAFIFQFWVFLKIYRYCKISRQSPFSPHLAFFYITKVLKHQTNSVKLKCQCIFLSFLSKTKSKHTKKKDWRMNWNLINRKLTMLQSMPLILMKHKRSYKFLKCRQYKIEKMRIIVEKAHNQTRFNSSLMFLIEIYLIERKKKKKTIFRQWNFKRKWCR